MHRFVNLNGLTEINRIPSFPNVTVQNLRRAVVAPVVYKPNIRQALRTANFRFHRTCSFSDLVPDSKVAEGQTLLIFWGFHSSDSRVTMSGSSCSLLRVTNAQNADMREKELRSTTQQTDISCRISPRIGSPVSVSDDEQRVLRERIADSFTFSSPASSLLRSTERSASILGSVCALLLKKQGSEPKEIASVNDSQHSHNICRICFGGESAERLVRPCCCRGTIAAVHRACLERWLLQAATSYCELCRHHYVVTRSHKYTFRYCQVEAVEPATI